MANGTHAFGALTYPGEIVADSLDPPQPQDPNAATDFLERIAEKYDGQPVEDINPFSIPAGGFKRFDFSQVPFSSFICSVSTGTVKVMIGEYSQQAGSPTLTAHFNVPSGGAPFQPLLATLPRIITLINDPAAATNAIGTFIITRP